MFYSTLKHRADNLCSSMPFMTAQLSPTLSPDGGGKEVLYNMCVYNY